MSSRIEQIIEEIEEYIDRDCKFQPLSTTKIIVNKEHLDELLRELRHEDSGRDQTLSEDYRQPRCYPCGCPGKGGCDDRRSAGTDDRAGQRA